MNTILKNCTLIDGTMNPIQEKVNILIIDSKIAKVSKNKIKDDKAITYDLTDCFVMPGLINAHVHLFGTGKPSKILGGGGLQKLVLKIVKTKFGNKIVDLLLAKNVKDILYSGVTTARSVGDFFYSDVRIRDKINANKAIGPRLLVSGPAITVPTGHGDGTFAITGKSPEELKSLVQEVAKHNVDLIKICITGGVMDAKKKGEPGELKMSQEEAKAVCDEAHKLGFKVASHTESTAGMIVAINSGVDTIEHGNFIEKEYVDKFKNYGGCITTTLSPALPLARLDPSLTLLNEMCVYNSEVVLDSMINCAKECMAENITVGLGTDASCPFCTQYNTYREGVYANKLLDIPTNKVINMLTQENSKILGIDKITGTIEVNKDADILILNKNPLDDLNNLKDIKYIIKQGKLYSHFKIKKDDMIETELDNMVKKL